MNFCWVTLPVSNLDTSLAFYHDLLGLPISRRHGADGMELVMLGEEHEPKIELICTAGNQDKKRYSDMSVGIRVESLGSAMELVKSNGIPIVRGPITVSESTSFFFIHDPDGYEVQLVEMKR